MNHDDYSLIHCWGNSGCIGDASQSSDCAAWTLLFHKDFGAVQPARLSTDISLHRAGEEPGTTILHCFYKTLNCLSQRHPHLSSLWSKETIESFRQTELLLDHNGLKRGSGILNVSPSLLRYHQHHSKEMAGLKHTLLCLLMIMIRFASFSSKVYFIWRAVLQD